MEKILFITDYIENQPVVASVRYEELIQYFNKKFEMIVLNDEKCGDFKSSFCYENLKYKTCNCKYTTIVNKKKEQTILEKMLRNNITLKLWRIIKYSERNFKNTNQEILKILIEKIKYYKIKKVLITVPDIYGVYIGKYIKENLPDIKILLEIRDIINNDIDKGNPKIMFKNVEREMVDIADKFITLSEGIYKYYKEKYKVKNIEIIKNGFNNVLLDEVKEKMSKSDEEIVFIHMGSIYKGRNIKDFILALNEFSRNEKKKVRFDIVGYLDGTAIEDVKEIKDKLDSKNLKINVIGTVPHEQAINYLINSDIAIILTHIKGSDYAIPGKTFEYIGAEKPILAVTTDKTLIDFISNKYGEIAFHNRKNILNKIYKILNAKYNFNDKNKYTRETQAKKIIKLLEFI